MPPLAWGSIQKAPAQKNLTEALSPLLGEPIDYLLLPHEAAAGFEPSQIGTIVGSLTDAVLPYLALQKQIGLRKAAGILGDLEGYPDFLHQAGYRLELKGVFRDNPAVKLKKPPTRREASARLTQKVTLNNVIPDSDGLLLIAYELQPYSKNAELLVPVIVDLDVMPVIDCVRARDHRLAAKGGVWFGNYQTPAILSRSGKLKRLSGKPLDATVYGRKESEGKDYNEDTNFGKLKRIPCRRLQEFLKRNGATYVSAGSFPQPWKIDDRYTVVDDED